MLVWMNTHHRVWTRTPTASPLPESHVKPQFPCWKVGNRAYSSIAHEILKSLSENVTFFIIVSFFHVSKPFIKAFAAVPATTQTNRLIHFLFNCVHSLLSVQN